jgi:phosphatidylinositol alpha-1,6-mannosyltransferase
MDVLVRAAAQLAPTHPDLEVIIAGGGRDQARLARLVADTGAPVRLVGRVDDPDLPALYGAGDVFAMACRNRWLGLEQEGFGIVFLEAAACGVPQVAGDSGGAAEAVADGETGLVVHDPRSVTQLCDALRTLIDDPGRRREMGAAARARAVSDFSYDVLARTLADALAGVAV